MSASLSCLTGWRRPDGLFDAQRGSGHHHPRHTSLSDRGNVTYSRMTIRSRRELSDRYGSPLPKVGDRLGRNGDEGFVTRVEADGPDSATVSVGTPAPEGVFLGRSQCSRAARRRDGEGTRAHPGRGLRALLETRDPRRRHRGGACQGRRGEVDALPPLPVERSACPGVPAAPRAALDA